MWCIHSSAQIEVENVAFPGRLGSVLGTGFVPLYRKSRTVLVFICSCMWVRTLEIGATYVCFVSGAKDKAMINLVCYAKLCFWTAERGICQWSAPYKNVIPLVFWSSNLSSLYLFPWGRISQQMERLHTALFLKLLFFIIFFFSLNARRLVSFADGKLNHCFFFSSNCKKVLILFLMRNIAKLTLSVAVLRS